MFLTRRATQAEYFDSDRPVEEWREFFRSLNRMNRWFGFAEPFKRALPMVLGPAHCEEVTVLDVGAGDGELGRELTAWARQREWTWKITNLDSSAAALSLAPEGTAVKGSALELPFEDGSFDAVIASQMTHHLGEAEAARHLSEAWRVARRAVVICDLHRNAVLYACLAATGILGRFPRLFVEDCLTSVKRAWRLPELRRVAAEAGLRDARASLYYGARVLLTAAKPGHQAGPD